MALQTYRLHLHCDLFLLKSMASVPESPQAARVAVSRLKKFDFVKVNELDAERRPFSAAYNVANIGKRSGKLRMKSSDIALGRVNWTNIVK